MIDLDAARDQALLAGLAARDPAALRALFDRHAPAALALARRVTADPGLAEDVVQEAFLAVWEHPEAYEPSRGGVRAWLISIIHHRAVDRVRRESGQQRRARREAALAEGAPSTPGPEDTVVEALDLRRRREAVRAALVAIPDPQRRILEMMYFDGMTQTLIAAELDLPLGTVKSRALLGMRKLHAALAVGEGGPS